MTRAPIGLFYGSSTCYTEMTAEKLVAELGSDKVDCFNVVDTPIGDAEHYAYLILGIPTWDYGELQEDWENIWPEIDEVDMQGRQVALFGQGDQVGYPEWFLDAMGYLHDKLVLAGAIPCGYWPVVGYQFEASKALTANQDAFVGLALDDENEFDLSDERIKAWCALLRSEWNL